MLDHVSRWDEEVNWDDQQRLMLARLLIHRPRWLVLDEMLDSIDGDTRSRAFEIFSRDLKSSAILHIGRGNAADPSFTRLVRVVKHPGMRSLARREPHEGTLPPGMSAVASA
jgi:putative ATP-binding cassette transporter